MNQPIPEDFVVPSNKEKILRKLDDRDKIMRTFEVFVLVALVVITLFSLLRLSQVASTNETNIVKHAKQVDDVASANRVRLDVGLCIFSVSPTRRTPEYVKSCYDFIEKQSGIKVQRFGDGI